MVVRLVKPVDGVLVRFRKKISMLKYNKSKASIVEGNYGRNVFKR